MATDCDLLVALGAVLGVEGGNDVDAAEAAFDRLWPDSSAIEWDPDLVRRFVLALERYREAGELVREVTGDRLLYYPPYAADLDADGRVEEAARTEEDVFWLMSTGHGHLIETWRPGREEAPCGWWVG